MNRLIWGFVKTFFVTYGFVLGTETDWTTWHDIWFSLVLAAVGAAVGVAQTAWDYWRKPEIALGDEPTDDEDDTDYQAI